MKSAWPTLTRIPEETIPAYFQEDFLQAYARFKDINSNVVCDDYFQKLGADFNLARSLIQQWTESPYESPLRWGVSVLAGHVPMRELNKIQTRSRSMWKKDIEIIHASAKSSDERARREARALSERNESFQRMEDSLYLAATPEYLRTISAMATITQMVMETETVSLYRGVHGAQAKAILSRVKRDRRVPIALDQTTSFTSSPMIAETFAFENHRRHEKFGLILRVKVPRTAVVASPKIFYELRGESETIVASQGSVMLELADVEVIDGYG